jgi:hypothetical protein
MAVGGVEEDLRWQMAASRDKSCCGGRDDRRSAHGEVDDDADKARGCDGRILV